MNICPRCGSVIADGRYCEMCGIPMIASSEVKIDEEGIEMVPEGMGGETYSHYEELNPVDPSAAHGVWVCPHCGFENPDDKITYPMTGSICAKCGQMYVDNVWICVDCGNINYGGNYCGKCGKLGRL